MEKTSYMNLETDTMPCQCAVLWYIFRFPKVSFFYAEGVFSLGTLFYFVRTQEMNSSCRSDDTLCEIKVRRETIICWDSLSCFKFYLL